MCFQSIRSKVLTRSMISLYFTYKFAEYGHCLQGRLPLNYDKRLQKEYADFLFYRRVHAATTRTLTKCHMS